MYPPTAHTAFPRPPEGNRGGPGPTSSLLLTGPLRLQLGPAHHTQRIPTRPVPVRRLLARRTRAHLRRRTLRRRRPTTLHGNRTAHTRIVRTSGPDPGKQGRLQPPPGLDAPVRLEVPVGIGQHDEAPSEDGDRVFAAVAPAQDLPHTQRGPYSRQRTARHGWPLGLVRHAPMVTRIPHDIPPTPAPADLQIFSRCGKGPPTTGRG